MSESRDRASTDEHTDGADTVLTDGGSDDDTVGKLRRIARYLALGIGGFVVLIAVLFALGIIGLPGAELEDNRWGEVEGQDVAVITEVVLDNPNPFGFGGDADVTYDVDLQGVRLAEGEDNGIDIGSGANSLNFTTTLFAENLPPWWSSHLNNGEVSQLEADATADVSLGPLSGSPGKTVDRQVETDIEGALDESSDEFEGEYSLTGSGLQVEPSIEIEDATTEWGEVTEEQTEIVTTMTIRNNNPFPIPTPAFAGGVEMNGESLVDWRAGEVRILDGAGNEVLGEEALIPPNEAEERAFVAEMNNENVSVWFPTHIDSEQPTGEPGVEFTDMVITAQLAVEINGERLTIPAGGQAFACEFDLTTSIFVDQESGIDAQGCGLTEFEQPRDKLEAVGAVIDLDDEGGILP
jgi:LEA14-like dessication related protein